MSTYMSKDVLDDLQSASLKAAQKKTRMRVEADGQIYPIVRFSEDRFSLSATEAPYLRGYVDILDGTRLKYRALIMASEHQQDELVFEFKQATSIAKGPALDFEQKVDAPVGYLEAL